MIGTKLLQKELHHTEKEFLRIVEELRKQEELDGKREGQIISALRAHAEGSQQLNKQMGRLIRSTTILATTQILLVALSIIVAIYLGLNA